MAKLGIELHSVGWDFKKLKNYCLEVEAMGFDSVWVQDNIVWIDQESGRYEPVYEAWTTLAALAGVSNKIRLGPMVTPCRRRHPALLAKMISTVDIVSNGRLNVGLGTGDIESHFEFWGMSLPSARERVEILREEIEIMKRLWTEEVVSHQGNHYTLCEAVNQPQPVQKPHPPIWLGLVLGRKLMPKLVADVADSLNVYTCSDRAAVEHLENVEKHCQELGRDFSDVHKSRSVYISLTEKRNHSAAMEQDLRATLAEQAKRVKSATNVQLEYQKVTQRHVVGSHGQIAEELVEILDMGFEEIILIGLDSLTSLELLAKEVLPILKTH